MTKTKRKQRVSNLIIDSNNLLHRAHWIAESRGGDMSTPYLFLNSIKKYVKMFRADNIYTVWDKKLAPELKNFRMTNDQIEYKATRDKERNDKVYKHEPIIRKIVKYLGVRNIYPGVMEGDDVAAYLSTHLPGSNIIVSVDQDFLQLVNDNISVYSPIKDILITRANFFDIVDVEIKDFLKYKALLGDKSDNIPGIPKVGEKTAKKIIKTGIDTLSSKHLEIFHNNMKLMSLKRGYTTYKNESLIYKQQVDRLSNLKPDMQGFLNICESLNMKQVTKNINEWKSLFTNDEQLVLTIQKLINSL